MEVEKKANQIAAGMVAAIVVRQTLVYYTADEVEPKKAKIHNQ
jgi:hypothetical protein